jgi:hypothetical protein
MRPALTHLLAAPAGAQPVDWWNLPEGERFVATRQAWAIWAAAECGFAVSEHHFMAAFDSLPMARDRARTSQAIDTAVDQVGETVRSMTPDEACATAWDRYGPAGVVHPGVLRIASSR